MEHVKEVLGWKKKKKQVWGKLLYVFGYGKNWWKSDEKLLIFIMCLQKEKEKKEKEKWYKVTLWKEKKCKVKKKMRIKEVHNEVSSSQD